MTNLDCSVTLTVDLSTKTILTLPAPVLTVSFCSIGKRGAVGICFARRTTSDLPFNSETEPILATAGVALINSEIAIVACRSDRNAINILSALLIDSELISATS